jgi:hypothetical protein
MTTVQLSNTDARLAYLAVQYHLARPGSELDPVTKQQSAHGLAEVVRELEPQLERAVATIELSDRQRQRLVSAIAGAMNELKSSPLLAGGGRTMVPAFQETLRRLFPKAADDPDETTQLAGHLLALRRRLEQVESAPVAVESSSSGRRWWRFWQRTEGRDAE